MSNHSADELYDYIRESLLQCEPFAGDAQLQAVFGHPTLRPWKDQIRTALSLTDRVDAVLTYLWDKRQAQTNARAIVLLLRVLRSRIDPGDAQHIALMEVEEQLSAEDASTSSTAVLSTALQIWLETSRPFDTVFATLIDDRTKDFTGRIWVFQKLSAWLAEATSGVFLITGEPGKGKTAIAARLCQFSTGSVWVPGGIGLPGIPFLLASHFCTTSSNDTLDPRLFVAGLARQLAANSLTFAQALRVSIPNLADLHSASQVWTALIRTPLAAVTGAPLTILVDSLDEATQQPGYETIVDLLAGSTTWPQVRWVLTSRPEPSVLARFPYAHRLDLIADADRATHEVRDYAATRVIRELSAGVLSPTARADLADRAAAPEQGNFLYARHLLDDLLPRVAHGEQSDLDRLPAGLAPLYIEFLGRVVGHNEQAWQERYRPLLSAIATALGEGLNRDTLSEITALSRQIIHDSIHLLKSYLTAPTVTGPFRLYHHSFADFLFSDKLPNGQDNPRWIDRAAAHLRTAIYFLNREAHDWSAARPYAVRYTPTHLLEALAAGEATASHLLMGLFTNLHYLTIRLQTEVGNTWPLEQELTRASVLVTTLEHRALLTAYNEAIRRESHVLRQRPEDCYVQLRNHLWRGDGGPIDQALMACSPPPNMPWLRTQHPLSLGDPAFHRKLTGHMGPVNAVAITEDGRLAVSGGADEIVRVWNVATGQVQAVLHGHTDWVRAVAVTGDGRLAVSGGDDGTVRVWNVATAQVQVVLHGHLGSVGTVAVTGDGRLVISGGADHTVRVWNVTTGRVQTVLRGHTGWVRAVAITGDGRLVVSGGDDGTVRVWDATTGQVQAVLHGHTDWVRAVAVTEDGRLVVSGGDDRAIRVWDMTTMQTQVVMNGHTDWVRALAVADDGQLVVSGGADLMVRVWDVTTGQTRIVLKGHSGWVNSVAVAGDGQLLISSAEDETVQVWDMRMGQVQTVLSGHTDWVRSVAIAGNGRLTVSGGVDHTLRVWNMTTGQVQAVLLGHTGWVNAVAITEDGRLAVSGGADEIVRVWNVATGQVQAVLHGHTDWVRAVAVTGDGRLAVSGGDDGTVRVWNVATAQVQVVLHGHLGSVGTVAVTGDGRLVISGGADHTVRVWNVTTGRVQTVLRGHTGWVNGVSVTGDGRLVVSGGDDGTVRVWDVTTRQVQAVLHGHTDWVRAVAVTIDGRLMVSVGDDRTVRVWNLSTDAEYTHYTWDVPLTSCAFSMDGSSIVLGDKRGRVLFFRLEGSL